MSPRPGRRVAVCADDTCAGASPRDGEPVASVNACRQACAPGSASTVDKAAQPQEWKSGVMEMSVAQAAVTAAAAPVAALIAAAIEAVVGIIGLLQHRRWMQPGHSTKPDPLHGSA